VLYKVEIFEVSNAFVIYTRVTQSGSFMGVNYVTYHYPHTNLENKEAVP